MTFVDYPKDTLHRVAKNPPSLNFAFLSDFDTSERARHQQRTKKAAFLKKKGKTHHIIGI